MGMLDGQRAIVTGAGSGIGRATALRMAEEGARVAVLDVDAPRAAEVASLVDGSALVVDVADPLACTAAIPSQRVGRTPLTEAWFTSTHPRSGSTVCRPG